MKYQYRVRLPATEPHQLDQDESYFYLNNDGHDIRIRFHEYGKIFSRPGLYEQLFCHRLKCGSPKKIADILGKVLRDNHAEMSELRLLDLGAGNGMFGEQLHSMGIARIIGVDILEEARLACERDRPGIYDAYYVRDLSEMSEEIRAELAQWQIDCLSCVAALGFGDIPPRAFANAYNLVADGGWVAFNIKETFLLESDTSGFSVLVKTLLLNDALEVHHLERYRHRISIDGRPLYYYALVGRKESAIPQRLMPEPGSA
jgi:hypothetical protein